MEHFKVWDPQGNRMLYVASRGYDHMVTMYKRLPSYRADTVYPVSRVQGGELPSGTAGLGIWRQDGTQLLSG